MCVFVADEVVEMVGVDLEIVGVRCLVVGPEVVGLVNTAGVYCLVEMRCLFADLVVVLVDVVLAVDVVLLVVMRCNSGRNLCNPLRCGRWKHGI